MVSAKKIFLNGVDIDQTFLLVHMGYFHSNEKPPFSNVRKVIFNNNNS